ncbi:hypothetical protein [Oscillatoria acuminata]|uniref:Uncharacterized protein n=1 Tax=Oscillatoria acuminata PCC 6304 TaxID=56110 RepID=K9TFS1_9CYAN|nr:hypothetical protein Oscil6304_1696 [Oscillatoria acuminata PCC 6304]
MLFFLFFLFIFFLSLLTTGWLKQRFSQNLLDIPNEIASATLRDRSSHSQPTPSQGAAA